MMRALLFPLLAFAVLTLTGCSTPPKTGDNAPETMLVSYQAKAGKDAALRDALDRMWKIYRADKLVWAKPHLLVRDQDDNGNVSYVESFTWVSHNAPDHAPPNVKAIWRELESLCEPRGAKKGIDGEEVQTVVTG